MIFGFVGNKLRRIKNGIICIVLGLLACLFNCSCISSLSEFHSHSELMKEHSDEIVRCFDEKDADGIKVLLSESLKSAPDIDEQIENIFSFYEGESISYDYKHYAMSSGGKRDGEWFDKHYAPEIVNLITDEGKEYIITFLEYVINEEDSSKVGIVSINLIDIKNKNDDLDDERLAQIKKTQ